ncbi:hypothetical protein BG004_007778 [Podila humilis]|nr:hypothetical protein BG004_007778 [Podila humilis]
MIKLSEPQLLVHEATKAAPLYNRLFNSVDGVNYTTQPWTNWAGNVSATPERTFHPKTLDDLKVVVREATTHNKKVRCAGSGHSWSAVAATNDYLVDIKSMSHIRTPVKHPQHDWTVTIEMGVLVSDLDDVLRKHNPPLALPSNVVPDVHGPITNARTMSDLVTEMQILNAKGELVTYSEAKDPEAFSAACLNLGLLGIVYTATLKVDIMNTRLRVKDSYPALASIFHGLDAGLKLKEIVLKNDGTEILYWPSKHSARNNDIWVKLWERTTEPAQSQTSLPGHAPMADSPMFASFQVGERVLETPDAMHFEVGDSANSVVDAGCAIKADSDFNNIVRCFNDLVERMRFVKSSNKMMSPVYDQDSEAIYSTTGTPGFDEFSTKVMKNWIEFYNAKPHWAKLWEAVPEMIPYLRHEYGDRLVRFNRIRKEQDPNDMFVNTTFEKFVADF